MRRLVSGGSDSHIVDPANLKDDFPELVDICTLKRLSLLANLLSQIISGML